MESCPVCAGCGQVEADYDYQLFVYTVQPPPVATGGGFVLGTFQIDTDADFKLYQIVATSTLPGGTAGTFKILMTEPGKGSRNWMSAPIDSRNFAGSAQLPAYLYIPYLMKRQQLYSFTFTDTSGTAGNSIELDFVGYKLWPKSS